jgi:mxaD protein
MPHLTNTIEIKASPEAVWAVLGDLTATPHWLPGTVAARIDGNTRVCVMDDGSQVQEQISGYSADDRTYAWRHLQVPLPVRDSHGTYTVRSADAGSATVTLHTRFEPLDPAAAAEVAAMIEGAFQQSLEALRRFVEQGVRWRQQDPTSIEGVDLTDRELG